MTGRDQERTGASAAGKRGATSRLLAVGGILMTFVAGVLVGRVVPEPGEAPVAPLATPESRVTPAGEPDGGNQTAYDFQTVRPDTAPRAVNTQDDGAFGYRRLVLETGDLRPQACLQFSAPLDTSGKTQYTDYIRISPNVKPAIAVKKTSLCLGGLAFDTDYRVTLRAGLPAADGTGLAAAETVTVAFGDKPAFVGFAGDGVILPRLEADGIGIETVNVDSVKISVHRISDRGIFRKAVTAGEAAGEDDYSYIYGEDDGEGDGARVYQGTLDTRGDPNTAKTTVFALGATLKSLAPGAYFVKVEDTSQRTQGQRRKANAWRWIMYTDMAMTSYRSDAGLDVFVRSIASARPLRDVEVVLLARNNDVLARATTNADGRITVDGALLRGEGAMAPRYVLAYGERDDFAAQDLNRTPLDLSENKIGGRQTAGPVDGFVYLDRGIYRPGETVQLGMLLRDQAGNAIEGRGANLKIFRPNGTLADDQRLDRLQLGGATSAYEVPRSAARGLWRVSVVADGAGAVAGTSFSVEDFVPQRLEVTLEADETSPIGAGETRPVTINARYLYGAPASNLAVESEVRYRKDPNPFPDYQGYRFGPAQNRINETFRRLPNQTTDDTGAASLTLAAKEAPAGNGAPLRADLVVGVVEPGGRVVRESARIPVRQEKTYVGLRLADNARSVGRNEEAVLEAVLLDAAAQPAAGELEWRLVREDYWFDWYRDGGQWRWRRQYRDILVDEGRVSVTKAGRADVRKTLDSGSYRLTAWQAGSRTKTEKRFYVGWRSQGAGADAPDQAVLTLMDKTIKPGTRARLFLDAPYAGEAMIVVATDKIHRIQRVRVEEEGREIVIDTDPSWGTGFYVMATIVTPRDSVAQPIPRRAMGVAHVPYDMGDRTLSVEMKPEAVLRPRQQLDLPVSVTGAAQGEQVMMTIAAVDEGILRLTKFKSPDLVGHYFGKKALGLTLYDDYGRILNANLGAAARFGGDQIGGEGLTVVPTKSVALFSGLVTVDGNGQTTVPIKVPDFNGELRLMAVAWSSDKLGNSAMPLTVRDRVPAEISLSRFLAPGDSATATLLLDNVDGAAGDYQVSVDGSGPVNLDQTQTFTLAKGEKKVATYPFTAGSEGIGFVALNVTGPDGFDVTRTYPIQVRSPWFPVTQTRTITQQPGESFVLTQALVDTYVPGSAALSLSYSRLRAIEPGPLLDALYRYPYGCTEQLVSSSFPLLFVDRLGGEVGRGPDRAVRPRVQAAINKLLDRQGRDGAIGLWRVGDRYGNAWLGPYVTDFLFRARTAGYAVPDTAMDLSYQAVANIAKINEYGRVGYVFRVNAPDKSDTNERLRLRSAAYAHYVLARAGRGDLSDLRYLHDRLLEKVKNPLAMAHVGAALAQYGDKARADHAFRKALDAAGYANSWNYYQTPLRDAAAVVALIAEAGFDHLMEPATDQLTARMKDPKAMHTQEKAFVLMAANALIGDAPAPRLAVDGKALTGLAAVPVFTPDATDIDAGQTFENQSDQPLYLSITRTGTPKTAPAAAANGVRLAKRVLTRQGQRVDLASVAQNDRFVIELSGAALDKRTHPFIVADLLPAGFEIETIIRPNDRAYPWLKDVSFARIAEARDDRFVAAVNVNNGQRFKLAYLVRAVTPGQYTMPGGVIEDMYRPGVFARTTPTRLTIAAADGQPE
ncbi:MAG: alpha-2-macroglobulin [Pseudomonadota bacterium]